MRQSPSTTPGAFHLGVFRWRARRLRTNVTCCRALCHFVSLPVACEGRRRGLQSQLRSPMTLNEMHPISQALLIAGAATILALPALGDPRAKHQQARPVATTRIVQTYGKLPLSFEANRGQTNQNVKFLSRGRGYTLFLTGDGSALSLKHGADSGVVRTRLLGANSKVVVSGADRLPGASNYFIGNDPAKWRTGIPSYGKVRYAGVYPGVDLVYYGNQGKLEYDFVVAPTADPGRIAMRVDGGLKVDKHGDLVVATNAGAVRFHKPVAYQPTRANGKDPVDVAYVLKDGNTVGFRVAAYDRAKALIIDPVLSYSTYLGGSGDDYNIGMVVDGAGNAYLTGETTSTNYPIVNPEQPSNAGGWDAFVTKINPAGTSVVYSTYLGGSGGDAGYGIAVDSAGNAYVGGTTSSSDFPTVNPFQTVLNGGRDAFVAKLAPAGDELLYSTYLGGSSSQFGLAIAVDGSEHAYIAGETTSVDFPILNPIQTTCNSGTWQGFVTKMSATGSSLVYSTYLCGNSYDQPESIAVDSSGNAYIAGQTESTNFPTVNPLQPTNAGGWDAFITKINPAGNAYVYSTYLGGTADEQYLGIAVDRLGSVYIAGTTTSADFPTKRAIQPSYGGNGDAFLTKINAAGSALVYSTYLGGSGQEGTVYPNAIAVDSLGNAYLAGFTYSSDFPTVNPTQAANAGNGDAFVAKVNAAGSALVYSSYLGGSGSEVTEPAVIGVDSAGNIYVYGSTNSTDFPTVNPIQAANAGGYDLFLTKIVSGVSLSKKKLTFPTQVVGTTSIPKTVTLTNLGSAALTIRSITSTDPTEFQVTNTCGASVAAGGSCDINVTFSPTASGTRTGKIRITDSELGSPQTITVAGTGTYVSLSPVRLNFASHKVGTTTAARTVTVTDVGTAAMNISSIGNVGADAPDFPILGAPTTTCGVSLGGGASCKIGIQFKPTATGTRTATLDITDDGGGSPQKVALSGTGT